MAIVQCGNKVCNRQYNQILPVCPYCGSPTDSSIMVDSEDSLHDGTGSNNFKIIHRLDNPLGSDVTIFKKDSCTYGVAKSIQDIILPRMNYIRFSYIDEIITGNYLRASVKDSNGKEKWGVIDTKGNYILDLKYDFIWKHYPSDSNHQKEIFFTIKDGKKNQIDIECVADTGEIKVIKSEEYICKPRSIITGRADSYFSDTDVKQANLKDNNFIDEVCSVFNSPFYNDALDIDQQSPEFWNSI